MASIESTLTLPALDLQAELRTAGRLDGDLTLPALQVEAEMRAVGRIEADIQLPALQVEATLRSAFRLDAELALPALQIQGGLNVGKAINAGLTLPPLSLQSTLKISPVIRATLTLPALQVQANLKLLLRKGLGCEYSISVRRAFLWKADWWMWTRDVVRTLAPSWSLSVPRRTGWQVDWSGPRRTAYLQSTWSIRVGTAWQATSGMASVQGLWRSAWGSRVARNWGQSWACCAFVKGSVVVQWASAPTVRQALATTWSSAAVARHAVAMDWASSPSVRTTLQVGWSLTAGAQRGAWSAAWEASERERVRARLACPWMLLPDVSAAVVEVPVTAMGAAGALRFDRFSLAQSRDDGLWRLSATVLGMAPEIGEALSVTLGATTYELVVIAAQATQQTTTDGSWEIRAASAPVGWSDLAINVRDDLELSHGGMASALAAQIAAPLAMAWVLPDWYLSPPVVAQQLANQSAWQGLQALAKAAGGAVLCDPDGATLRAVPFSGPALGTVVALEASPTREPTEASGGRATSHAISDRIAIEGEGRQRTVLVTPYPWRPVSVRLAGGAQLQAKGESLEEREEVVALIGGTAELTDPADQLISARLSGGGTGLLWRAGERYVWLATGADAVATVRYRTRVLRFALTSSSGDPVNILVEDLDP